MFRIVKLIVGVLVVIGIVRGVVNYTNSTGDNVLERLGSSIIDTAADLTYKWIPVLVDWVSSLAGQFGG